jgi:hypothetical protein
MCWFGGKGWHGTGHRQSQPQFEYAPTVYVSIESNPRKPDCPSRLSDFVVVEDLAGVQQLRIPVYSIQRVGITKIAKAQWLFS